jgi:hypothetical protein
VSPVPGFVSLSGNTLTADATLATSADVGTINVNIDCDSANWPLQVVNKQLTWPVTVSECKATTISMITIADVTRTVNEGPATFVFNPPLLSNNACLFDATYSDSYVLSGSSIARPLFISFNGLTRTITIDPIIGQHVGVYTVTITATLPQPAPNIATSSFTLTVIPECSLTSLQSRSINDMTVRISEFVTQDITLTDSLASLYSIPNYCGPRIYTFTEVPAASTPYLTYVMTNGVTILTLSTNDVTKVGIKLISMTASLQNYSSVSLTISFSVTI